MNKFVLCAALTLLLAGDSVSAQSESLSYLTRDGKSVKVFLDDFSNKSGQDQIKSEDFKNVFKNALLNRRSVNFQIVDTPDKSDVRISAAIKKYEYLKNDPINSFGGPETLVLDAVTTENYVNMEAEFDIVDTKTGKTVWKDTISAYKEKMMTPSESIPIIYEKISRTFLWRSFGKPRG